MSLLVFLFNYKENFDLCVCFCDSVCEVRFESRKDGGKKLMFNVG